MKRLWLVGATVFSTVAQSPTEFIESASTITFHGPTGITNSIVVDAPKKAAIEPEALIQTTLEEKNTSSFLSSLPYIGSIKNLKSKLIALGFVGSIPTVIFLYYYFKTNRLLKNKDNWLNWKPALSLGSLLSLPLSETKKDLKGTIKLRYQKENTESNDDLLYFDFAQDIAYELSDLERFIRIVSLIKLVKFDTVLPLNDILEQRALDGVKKLTFLKNIAFEEFHKEHEYLVTQ